MRFRAFFRRTWGEPRPQVDQDDVDRVLTAWQGMPVEGWGAYALACAAVAALNGEATHKEGTVLRAGFGG